MVFENFEPGTPPHPRDTLREQLHPIDDTLITPGGRARRTEARPMGYRMAGLWRTKWQEGVRGGGGVKDEKS